MSHYTEKAVIAYDADEAGRKEALRAIPLLEKTGMGVKVVDMGDAKDPDEYLKKYGTDAFRLLLERSENHIEYRLMAIQNNIDMTTDEGRLAYLAAATELLSELESKPESEIYGARVAQSVGVSPEAVQNEVKKKFKIRKEKQRKDLERRVTHPTAAIQPVDKELRYENEYSAVAEEGVIRCIVRDSALMKTIIEMGFSQEEFTSPYLAKVYESLSKRISEGRDIKEALILSELTSSEAASLTSVLQKPEALPQSDKTIREYIGKIRSEKYKTVPPDGNLLLEIKKYKQGLNV